MKLQSEAMSEQRGGAPQVHSASNLEDSICVLVVDDTPQNQLAMRALLEGAGVRVLCASSGDEALELLLVHDVAVALVDVQMPGMDGFALATLMRGAVRTRDIPIIFVTALPADADRALGGYGSGAVDFLHKPIARVVLCSKVAVFVELYRQRQALKCRAIELERALAVNEAMVAALGHDLRTPLAVISASAAALARLAAGEAAQRAVERVIRSGAAMSKMIEQLLDFARSRSGALVLAPQATDLGALAGRIVSDHQALHEGRLITLAVCGDTTADVDAAILSRVLTNLLSNALLHGSPESIVAVEVDGTSAASISVRVTNQGTIDPVLLPRLFQSFKPSRSSGSGLGLGLHIVSSFVEAHGGKVQASCDAGQVCLDFVVPRSRRSQGG